MDDLGAAAAGTDMFGVGGVVGRTDPEAFAVVGQHFQPLDVLDGLAGHDRMRAARVVADHAAQGAAAVGRRIGAEGQADFRRLVLELVADDTRLDPGNPPFGIDGLDGVQVLGGIDHHGDVHRLTAHRGACATRQDRHPGFLADGDGGDDIGNRPGDHHTDGQLPVVGRFRGVDGAGRRIEPDFGSGLRFESLAQVEQDVQVKRGGIVLGHGAEPSRSSARARRMSSPGQREDGDRAVL